jgi:hypothetical protein
LLRGTTPPKGVSNQTNPTLVPDTYQGTNLVISGVRLVVRSQQT